jgi:hypothetical protein
MTKSRTGSTARNWEGAVAELTGGGGERRQDDVQVAAASQLDHSVQKWRLLVVRSGGASPRLELASVGLELEQEGDGGWGFLGGSLERDEF